MNIVHAAPLVTPHNIEVLYDTDLIGLVELQNMLSFTTK